MKHTLRINFDLIIEADNKKTLPELLDIARQVMLEDGLGNYINEDTTDVVDENEPLPYVSRLVFGEELTAKLEEIAPDPEEPANRKSLNSEIRKVLKESCGELRQRKFRTRAELDAYGLGLGDMDGWERCESADDYKFIPDEIWEEENRE